MRSLALTVSLLFAQFLTFGHSEKGKLLKVFFFFFFLNSFLLYEIFFQLKALIGKVYKRN